MDPISRNPTAAEIASEGGTRLYLRLLARRLVPSSPEGRNPFVSSVLRESIVFGEHFGSATKREDTLGCCFRRWISEIRVSCV